MGKLPRHFGGTTRGSRVFRHVHRGRTARREPGTGRTPGRHTDRNTTAGIDRKPPLSTSRARRPTGRCGGPPGAKPWPPEPSEDVRAVRNPPLPRPGRHPPSPQVLRPGDGRWDLFRTAASPGGEGTARIPGTPHAAHSLHHPKTRPASGSRERPPRCGRPPSVPTGSRAHGAPGLRRVAPRRPAETDRCTARHRRPQDPVPGRAQGPLLPGLPRPARGRRWTGRRLHGDPRNASRPGPARGGAPRQGRRGSRPGGLTRASAASASTASASTTSGARQRRSSWSRGGTRGGQEDVGARPHRRHHHRVRPCPAPPPARRHRHPRPRPRPPLTHARQRRRIPGVRRRCRQLLPSDTAQAPPGVR